MNKKLLAGVVLGAVALAGGAAVAAANDNDERKAKRANQYITWKLDDALDELNASDAQKKQTMVLKDQLFAEGLKLRTTKERVREGLVQQWKAQNPDANTVHALVDQMLDEVRGFAHKAADAGLAFHKLLTPEQREAALQRHEERRARWSH